MLLFCSFGAVCGVEPSRVVAKLEDPQLQQEDIPKSTDKTIITHKHKTHEKSRLCESKDHSSPTTNSKIQKQIVFQIKIPKFTSKKDEGDKYCL